MAKNMAFSQSNQTTEEIKMKLLLVTDRRKYRMAQSSKCGQTRRIAGNIGFS
jgi:hypothetical protein